jgi:hypothetical protein
VTAQRPEDYVYWRARLRGEDPGLTDFQARCGFWRKPRRDGGFDAIHIFRTADDDLVARVNDRHLEEPDEAWCERFFAWCVKHPVTEESYRLYTSTGRWADDVPEVKRDTNAPPSVVIAETIAELHQEAKRWLAEIGGTVKTQEQADKAGNFAARFAELQKEAESARVAEKEQHLKAGREVDSRWKPISEAGGEAKRWATGLTTEFLKARRAELQAAAATSTSQGQPPTPVKVKAGTRGRSTHLRSYQELEYAGVSTLIAHYAQDERFMASEQVVEALERLAMVDLKAGLKVPGVSLVTKEKAV